MSKINKTALINTVIVCLMMITASFMRFYTPYHRASAVWYSLRSSIYLIHLVRDFNNKTHSTDRSG